MGVCFQRVRKVFTMMVQGSRWCLAPGDAVKVLSGRSGVACGGLLRAYSERVHLDDAG